MGAKVRGFEKVLANLKKYTKLTKGAIGAAIYQEGMAIMRDAKVYCPVDTGRLRASGYVAPPETLDNPQVSLGFGTNYALPVHERVEVFHEVGQPLYLKRAVDEHAAGYTERIAARARANIEKGTSVAKKGGG